MHSNTSHSVTVIGAGIVGLCVAYALRKEGFAVQVIDPEGPGFQCSFGNAGAISTGSVAPLAMPGILKSAAKMLHEEDSPLYVPPHITGCAQRRGCGVSWHRRRRSGWMAEALGGRMQLERFSPFAVERF